MRILLTNDDGIWAPGLAALHAELKHLGDVEVSAPAINQSAVGHGITHLKPLMVQEAFHEEQHFGWEVNGSPADCVKLAMLELLPALPDLVVSGINSGANAGINVLYSGTVAAAVEGAFFGVTSIAVSLTSTPHPDYERAARWACGLIPQLLAFPGPAGRLWNINFPVTTPEGPKGVRFVPMGVKRYEEFMEARQDPWGRTYYWSGADKQMAHASEPDTDVEGLVDGFVTVTPLHFDLTNRSILDTCRRHNWIWPPQTR